MNSENFQGEPERANLDHYDSMGSKDKLGVFMENEKFKQCFERRSECVYYLLERGFDLTKSGTVTGCFSQFAFP